MPSADFRSFVPEALDALTNVSDRHSDEFNIHTAFVYWIAELFETTADEAFVFTDGANDHSIDFGIRGPQTYAIYQCKCPEASTLETALSAPSYDTSVVNELLEAVSFMRDTESDYKSNAKVRDLRSDFLHDAAADSDATHLEASLAILGVLTPAAQKTLDAARDALYAEGVTVNLIQWDDIKAKLESVNDGDCSDVAITLHVDDIEKDVLHQKDWVYALVYARDLVSAMEEYGVRLFDLNVRHEIPNSRVNREIVKSVQHASTRRLFHHLNNGLLVTCSTYAKKAPDRIVARGAQVVNGCQSVSSLYHAYKALPPRHQQEFNDTVKIGVKLIRNADPELLEQIVISTNNQNPMKPRNLRSNAIEQRSIQSSFRDLSPRWFYVRKDGEFEALCAAGKRVPWFSRKDYRAELPAGMRVKDRVLDNVTLAKAWYAWIGSSHSVLAGGQDYFGNEPLYDRVFKKRPSLEYWSEFAQPDFEGAAKSPMEDASPGAHQYLLAATASSFLRATSMSSYANRKSALMRGLEAKKLKGNAETGVVTSSMSDQAAWLAQDQEYMYNTYLINMEDVLVELLAFMLVRRYGALTAATSRQLLRLPDFDAWQRSGFLMPVAALQQAYPDGVLVRSAQFIRWAAKNYCGQYKFQIDAAPRSKMYFARRDTVKAMRRSLLEADALTALPIFAWKTEPGRTFMDTLPAIDVEITDF